MRMGVITDFALSLISEGLIKFGEFRLKLHETNPDAPLSPIYIDLRPVRSLPTVMDQVVGSLIQFIETEDDLLFFQLIADVPTAATPIVAVLSHKLRVPMITPREEKSHGIGGGIDGRFMPGQNVLLVDDLITNAGSKLAAIATLEKKGLKVTDVLVIVDREQGGTEELKKRGYNLHSIFRLSGLLDYYLQEKMIDQDTHKWVQDYLRQK